jgi:signal peptidase I
MRSLVKPAAWIIGVMLVVGGLSYAFIVDAWQVPGDDPRLAVSLTPNAHPGDLLLVSRSTGGRLGWLVRCPDPDAPGRFVMGRVLATGGQTITVDQDLVAINGRRFTLPMGCGEDGAKVSVVNPANNEDVDLNCTFEETGSSMHKVTFAAPSTEARAESRVDPGKVYLVSDDRHFHLDSRDFGQVDADGCQHIIYRLWGKTGWGDSSGRLTLLY